MDSGGKPLADQSPHEIAVAALDFIVEAISSAGFTPGKDFALGNAGAGLGATAGRLKGGIGSASLRLAGGAMVGAIVAVNSWGATVRPDCGRFWAADLALAGEIPPQPAIPIR